MFHESQLLAEKMVTVSQSEDGTFIAFIGLSLFLPWTNTEPMKHRCCWYPAPKGTIPGGPPSALSIHSSGQGLVFTPRRHALLDVDRLQRSEVPARRRGRRSRSGLAARSRVRKAWEVAEEARGAIRLFVASICQYRGFLMGGLVSWFLPVWEESRELKDNFQALTSRQARTSTRQTIYESICMRTQQVTNSEGHGLRFAFIVGTTGYPSHSTTGHWLRLRPLHWLLHDCSTETCLKRTIP